MSSQALPAQAEQLFRYLFEQASLGIAVEDTEGKLLLANPALCSMLGYRENQLCGMSCSEFANPEDSKDDWALFQQLRAGVIDQYSLEKRYVRKDGAQLWGRLNVSLFKNGDGGSSPLVFAFVEDITERKRTEDAIRESENRYRRIVETTNDGVWLLDSNLRTCYVNRHMEEMLGYEPGEMAGRSVFDFHFPEDVEHKKQVLSRRQQGMREQIEERLRRRNGSELWVRTAANPIVKHTGEFDGALAIVSDITERRRAEGVLRGSEERLRLAVQAGKMYAYEWDVATDRVVRSEEHVKVLGSDQPRQLTRQELLARVHPDDRALFVASVDQLTPEKPTTKISYRLMHPDGSVVWLEKNARAFFDEQGKMLRVIGMVADITERRRAEQALRESEARLRLAAQAGRMYVYEWDVATDVTVRSEEYANILGLTGVPKGETHQHFSSRVHPDDRAKFNAAVADLTPENPTTQISYRVLRPDGAVTWLEKSGRAFFDAHGRMLRMIGIVADITERKLAEEALANVSRRLIEAQEQERTRIARELHDDIGQRLAMLTIELQQLREDSLILPEVRSRMGELQKQTSEIAADIQSLSHELHSAKLQYLGIAAAMRGFCREFGEQQKMEIDFQTHDLPSPMPPDTALCFFRVLQEALHNSAKHSGVRHFEVRLWGTSDEIHLTIVDSGAGFDREAAKKSRGLGLISIEERLKLVNGTLSIESQPVRGTTIHARVPLSSGSDSLRAAR